MTLVPAHQHRNLQTHILVLNRADLVLLSFVIDLLGIHLLDGECLLSHDRFQRNDMKLVWVSDALKKVYISMD